MTAAAPSDLAKGLRGMLDWLDDVSSGMSSSLARYSRDTNISSSVYMDRNIIEEPVMVPLVNILHQQYAGLVLTALGLNENIDGINTVRHMVRRVSSEGWGDVESLVEQYFCESDDLSPTFKMAGSNSLDVEMEKQADRFPTTKALKVDFNLPNQRKATVMLNVSLFPTPMLSEAIGGFITLNHHESILRRWKRVRAGDIKFVRDFAGCMDIIARRNKIHKSDRSGELLKMLSKRQNALKKVFLNLSTLRSNHNAASSIMIVERDNWDRTCSDIGFDPNRSSDMNRFFSRSFMLGVIIVDPHRQLVEMRLNGIPHTGTYSYDAITRTGSKSGGVDMKDLMSLLAKGQAPSF